MANAKTSTSATTTNTTTTTTTTATPLTATFSVQRVNRSRWVPLFLVHWFWASGPNNSVPFFAVFARQPEDPTVAMKPTLVARHYSAAGARL